MKHQLPPRRLFDWTPADGDQTEWLAELDAAGWVAEHRTGAEVVVNGRRVVRFAMVQRQQKAPARVEGAGAFPPGGRGAERVRQGGRSAQVPSG